ncbi:hypothetical protein [Deinococcus yavapaiensis]|uniref:hypothetical protein n=1 Tax=Deinococcus yavapaiensis TaxID=309889 RepID=UPI000DA16CB4|nr:hypothetical protein [Deinococcus yavapaiensis]
MTTTQEQQNQGLQSSRISRETTKQGTTRLRVRLSTYQVVYDDLRPYLRLIDVQGLLVADLFLAPSLHSTLGLDSTAKVTGPIIEERGDTVVLRFDLRGGVWRRKTVEFRCDDAGIDMNVTVEGQGALTDVHLFGGHYSGHLRYGSGFFQSGAHFSSVFNPEPTHKEQRTLPASQSSTIDVLGTSLPGKGHWFFTPAPLVYAVKTDPSQDTLSHLGADQGGTPAAVKAVVAAWKGEPSWLSMSIVAPVEELNFTAFHYDACESAFSLRVAYEGQTHVNGTFRTPTLRLNFVEGPYEALAENAKRHEQLGYTSRPPKRTPEWWSTPIQCGWGAQCHLANKHGGKAPDYCTQENYDDFLHALGVRSLTPGVLVLDDKWSATYGNCEVDPVKWPDLRGWIDAAHARQQKVLLWWKAWDCEGLPPEACILDDLGEPIAADPTSPVYEAILRGAVRRMLLDYDADGFKVDFSARTPSGPSLKRHGDAWGIHLLHRLLEILYTEAKACKPDALVMTHTPHPVFSNVTDMIRLNDVNMAADVNEQMTHRAKVTRAALPAHLIDTDNWPMPSIKAWRAYVALQPHLGIPSLYFATHVDGDGEELTEADYDFVRAVWGAHTQRNNS